MSFTQSHKLMMMVTIMMVSPSHHGGFTIIISVYSSQSHRCLSCHFVQICKITQLPFHIVIHLRPVLFPLLFLFPLLLTDIYFRYRVFSVIACISVTITVSVNEIDLLTVNGHHVTVIVNGNNTVFVSAIYHLHFVS